MLPNLLLRTMVRAYLAESGRLAKAHNNSSGWLKQENIAKLVFPGRQSAKNMLSRRIGTNPTEPATVAFARDLFLACRTCLAIQLDGLRDPRPQVSAAQFERKLCERLGIGWNGEPAAHSLALRERVVDSKSLADCKLPDLFEWRDGMFSFANDLRSTLDHSFDVLRAIAEQVGDVDSRVERLRLSRMAVSIASLNHPGSAHHRHVLELTLRIILAAGVYEFAETRAVDSALKLDALEQLYQFHFARIAPTLDSPFNYTSSIMRGDRIQDTDWLPIESDVGHLVSYGTALARLAPDNPWVYRLRCSALSTQARLLLARGEIRLADVCHELSLHELDRLGYPYGFAYPVLRAMSTGDPREGLAVCEDAISRLEATSRSSANAFAALHVQIRGKLSPGARFDDSIAAMAREAVSDVSTCYQCSHIFGAREVLSLVSRTARPASRRAKRS